MIGVQIHPYSGNLDSEWDVPANYGRLNSHQETEVWAGGVHFVDFHAAVGDAGQEEAVVAGVAELDADQRRANLAAGAFHVLEIGDVVLGTQDLVEEAPQRTWLLGEVDQEVVLATLVQQRTLHDIRIAGDVVVAARDDAQDP